MKIKNIEIDFDFLDADDVANFENELKKVVQKSNENKSERLEYSEALRKECETVEEFFDNMFGEGTSKEIFKGKMNLKEHIEAFQEIVNEKNRKQAELQSLYNKYAPNRQQRRKRK